MMFCNFKFQGSWIVRQSVGSTPCLLGKAVDITYIRGPNYLEVIIQSDSLFGTLFITKYGNANLPCLCEKEISFVADVSF
jgi:hypothetical protein